MNKELTDQIVKHIINGLLSDNSTHQSLLNNQFILNEKIDFELEDNEIESKNIFGCQFKIDNQIFKILMIDLSSLSNKEYYILLHLDNAPIYMVNYFELIENRYSSSSIYYSVEGYKWIACNLYLQATLLAGMEQLKNSIVSYTKCDSIEIEYNALLSFIEFLEENNEG